MPALAARFRHRAEVLHRAARRGPSWPPRAGRSTGRRSSDGRSAVPTLASQVTLAEPSRATGPGMPGSRFRPQRRNASSPGTRRGRTPTGRNAVRSEADRLLPQQDGERLLVAADSRVPMRLSPPARGTARTLTRTVSTHRVGSRSPASTAVARRETHSRRLWPTATSCQPGCLRPLPSHHRRRARERAADRMRPALAHEALAAGAGRTARARRHARREFIDATPQPTRRRDGPGGSGRGPRQPGGRGPVGAASATRACRTIESARSPSCIHGGGPGR